MWFEEAVVCFKELLLEMDESGEVIEGEFPFDVWVSSECPES